MSLDLGKYEIPTAEEARAKTIESRTAVAIFNLALHADRYIETILSNIKAAQLTGKSYCDVEIPKDDKEFILQDSWRYVLQKIPEGFELFCCYGFDLRFYINPNGVLKSLIDKLHSEPYGYNVFIVYTKSKLFLRIDWDTEDNTLKRLSRLKPSNMSVN